MSLEAAILENTATMQRLIDAWNKVAGVTLARPIATKEDPKKPAAVASGPTIATAKTEAAAPASTTGESNPAAQSAAPESQASTAVEQVTYDQVAKAITDGVKADRPRVVAALGKFGAKKGTELKPEQYAAFIKELA